MSIGRIYRDISSAAADLRSGQVTSEQLVTGCLQRIAARNEQLKSLVAVFAGEAMTAARQADAELARGDDRGPLHGIPIAIKDVIATREAPTAGGGKAWHADWHREDAEVVRRLRQAGAIIIGKTLTMEFAVGMPDERDATTVGVNPWDATRWAGGSSSGAGNGLAADFFLGAVGTDTGGSIRCPASYNGVSGLKPTFGLVSTEGSITWAYSLDHLGPLAHTADGCAALLAAIIERPGNAEPRQRPLTEAPPQPLEGTSPLNGLRVGVERAHHVQSSFVDAAVVDAFERAVQVLSDAGAIITEIELPLYDEVAQAAMLITPVEGYAFHRDNLRERWHLYGRQTRLQIAAGAVVAGADYVQARRVASLAKLGVDAIFAGIDVLVTPTTATPAPAVQALFGTELSALITDTIFTPYWDVLGNPALSIPMGFSANGLPLGLQIIGAPFGDSQVLTVASEFQLLTSWHCEAPPSSTTPGADAAAGPGSSALPGRPMPPGDGTSAPAEVSSADLRLVSSIVAGEALPGSEDEVIAMTQAYQRMRSRAARFDQVLADAPDVSPDDFR